VFLFPDSVTTYVFTSERHHVAPEEATGTKTLPFQGNDFQTRFQVSSLLISSILLSILIASRSIRTVENAVTTCSLRIGALQADKFLLKMRRILDYDMSVPSNKC